MSGRCLDISSSVSLSGAHVSGEPTGRDWARLAGRGPEALLERVRCTGIRELLPVESLLCIRASVEELCSVLGFTKGLETGEHGGLGSAEEQLLSDECMSFSGRLEMGAISTSSSTRILGITAED